MRISRAPVARALLATVALTLAAPVATFGVTSMAQAQDSARPGPASDRQRVDIDVFYAPLAEHGSWVQHPEYDYVFVPSGLDSSWRPYQEGNWVWTDQYGWYWESPEPFAWATYHYGRWGYEPTYGWFWVPGDTWAPAWVTWRRGGGKTGWAPIAPDSRGFAYGPPKVMDPPVAESWVFVEDRYITAPDLAVRVAPIADIAVWLRSDTQVYRPAYRDGVVMTRFVERSVFEPVVETRIVTRQVVFVDSYRDEFDDRGGRIGIYGPMVARANRVPAPPRFEREIRDNQRIMVREYVRDPVPGIVAPSAALLAVMNADQRRDLRERRWSGDERAYQREIEQMRERQRDRLQEQFREANQDAREIQQRRMEAIKARSEKLKDRVEQRQERAQQVMDRIQRERPNAIPARATDAPDRTPRPDAPNAGPGARPDAAPGARPNLPPRPGDGPAARPDVRPGDRPGAQAPDTPQRRPDAPTTPPDRPAPAAARDAAPPRSGEPERKERQAQPDRAAQPDTPTPKPPAPATRPDTARDDRPGNRATPDKPAAVPDRPDRGRQEQPAPAQMDRPQNAPAPRAEREAPDRKAAPERPARPERPASAQAQGDSSVRERLDRANPGAPPRSEPTTPPARERAQQPSGNDGGGAARPAPAGRPAGGGGATPPGNGTADGPGRN
ncbi:DUF6600 domain-containing protein [Xanthobacter sp. KR7-65]|uniref:DUF6600 domain-containing protein n=1 Tax=Xanthobacter sp. KR7-65 TaxID=3156612 RepID=UPI0032B6020A